MKGKIDKRFLKARTFWDVDFRKLKPEKNKEFIVKRVVHHGSDEEIAYIDSIFSYGEIYAMLESYIGVSPIVLNYYRTMAHASS